MQLSKWLIARDWNFEKAEDMLTKSLEWRKKWGMDSIESYSPPEVLKISLSIGEQSELTEEELILIIALVGNFDVRGAIQSSTQGDRIKYVFKILENALKETRRVAEERGIHLDKNSVIFDMENFSIREFTWRPAMEFVAALLKMYEANYPETLRYAFVINAPRLFSIVYNLVKPFLHENTIRKIRIYGYSGWKEDILEEVDPDMLPAHFGGNLTDPDGDAKCPSKINPGGPVPKHYYLTDKNLKDLNQNLQVEFKNNIILSQNESKEFEFKVDKSNSEIKWEFRSLGNDIGFVSVPRHFYRKKRRRNNLVKGSIHCFSKKKDALYAMKKDYIKFF
ncbi:SEC14-like protein 2 [Armadillidium nasatum]|uniref:SEC14-like protein 2 n=1 Tax=Armadillidium nasatum TaxID=96803 RepID=A0A5N5T8K2_9CRUS|nr:SEC14-like protein 2 [Armadillidium nasatum]